MDSLFGTSNTDTVRSSRIIYTPSVFARSSLLHLQETGTLQALHPHKSERSGLHSCLFFTVLSGTGRLVYEGGAHELQAGDCVFIDCRKPYSHETGMQDSRSRTAEGCQAAKSAQAVECGRPAESGQPAPSGLWSLQWCHFYGPNMNAIYRKYLERGGRPVFRPAHPEKYMSILTDLFQIAGSADYVRDMRIQEKLSSLLILLMEDAWDTRKKVPGRSGSMKRSAKPSGSALRDFGMDPSDPSETSADTHRDAPADKTANVQQVKEYLDENFREKITLDDLSARFFINKYYLLTLFKDRYGVTVTAYLNQMRVTWVKQQLRFTDRTAESLAAELQIEPAYLSRLFKKVEGVSPSEFRKSWKGDA